jgi:hypothetical protein
MKLKKQDVEKKIFNKFIKHTGWCVICIHSCNPPKPDILCEHKFGQLYYELTDNTSEEIQESAHSKDNSIQNRANWFKPFPDGYKKKFSDKKEPYEINSLSCELIIYFSTQPELGLHLERELHENVDWIRQHIKQSQFNKVWIYDYHGDRVLFCVCMEY